jgi:hypothetical protein
MTNKCAEVFNSGFINKIKFARGEEALELKNYVSEKMAKVPEFQYIREIADKLGLRVWLFGGTASSFLHYVKWDFDRKRSLNDFQVDRFDYDFTNIFRSTQDTDIVVDGSPEMAAQFQEIIAKRYPHFLGSKARWEVRSLRHRMGTVGGNDFKEALLNDADFSSQNSDSNSIGMIEITQRQESVVRDLKHWDQSESIFLEDTLKNRISFIRSDKHFSTLRAKDGENPEILSVIRLLFKAFQY